MFCEEDGTTINNEDKKNNELRMLKKLKCTQFFNF